MPVYVDGGDHRDKCYRMYLFDFSLIWYQENRVSHHKAFGFNLSEQTFKSRSYGWKVYKKKIKLNRHNGSSWTFVSDKLEFDIYK